MDEVELLKDILNKVEQIRHAVNELKIRQEVHNHILNEHHKRSTQLESRVIPIEEHVKFIQKTTKVMAWVITTAISLTVVIFGIAQIFIS